MKRDEEERLVAEGFAIAAVIFLVGVCVGIVLSG